VNASVATLAVAASAPGRPAPLAERLGAEAFARFHASVAPRLWAYVRSHVRDRSEADDLAQEAFTRVLASTFTPESEEHLIRYLYRTATNLLRDRGRSAARGTPVPLDEAELGEAPRPPAGAAARIDLERALRALRPKDRELLWLAHVEGIEHRQIAEMVGATPGSVRVLLFRARQRLAKLMQSENVTQEDRHGHA
jgi:RNA polymerase sigma-70 factor, ECF subfamily